MEEILALHQYFWSLKTPNKATVMLSSCSGFFIRTFGNSEYGRSKRQGEDLFLDYGKENDVKVCVYRFQTCMANGVVPTTTLL